MAYQNRGEGSLNYYPCRYGKSKLLFRGPPKDLEEAYVAFLGGTETYGKYVEFPFPDLVESGLGVETVNLGCVNAGVDVFLNDETVLDLCHHAKTTVVQIAGAQNMSNRFYAVHARRNDRFLRASTLLKTIYREIDFTDFNFTRHLLQTLEAVSEQKFEMVRQELRGAWVARMRTMAQKLQGDLVLLWLSDHSPDDEDACAKISGDPLFVNREMLEDIRPLVKDIVEVVATRAEVEQGYDLMAYSDLDAPAAREMLGPVAHSKAATAVQEAIARYL
ncbi:hypothetical protein SAMN04488117_106243 [Celeribacter baekdonensis]|uniref:DUF6473 domain-containing protein n=1 Tax=Celeribacter baekdonensis TaxID=875171 RepID=A0A1G7NCC4_9RHOB|nr:DUF6473 family protein [Celeribacter baekdonensis]SDF71612.1 hypothetical protein SAMN04488117_106243 [Celeribacter baekdonensis]